MIAQLAVNTKAGPKPVCVHCGTEGCRGECGRGTLPAERIELRQSSEGWHWEHVKGGGRLTATSHRTYATPLEAAIDGAIVAHCRRIPLRTGCNVLNQDLVFAWQTQGMERAQKGEPFGTCWNRYQRQGYLSVTQPQTFGWAEVSA